MSSLCFHLYVSLSRNSSLLKLNLNARPLEPELIKIRETTLKKKKYFIGRLMIQEKLAKFRFQLLSFGPFSATRETKCIKSVSDYWFNV